MMIAATCSETHWQAQRSHECLCARCSRQAVFLYEMSRKILGGWLYETLDATAPVTEEARRLGAGRAEKYTEAA